MLEVRSLRCGLMLAVGVLQYLGLRMELVVNLTDFGAYLVAFAVAGPTRRACRVDPQAALRAD